jgi:hypothetical protein
VALEDNNATLWLRPNSATTHAAACIVLGLCDALEAPTLMSTLQLCREERRPWTELRLLVRAITTLGRRPNADRLAELVQAFADCLARCMRWLPISSANVHSRMVAPLSAGARQWSRGAAPAEQLRECAGVNLAHLCVQRVPQGALLLARVPALGVITAQGSVPACGGRKG